MSNWARAAAVDDIKEGGARSFAHLDKRIALFRTPKGVFASDNRCPHQGYALVRGDVKDGALHLPEPHPTKREWFVLQSTLAAITTLRGLPKPESNQVRPA